MVDTLVNLDRRFNLASVEADQPYHWLFNSQYGRFGWSDLLEKPRVVVLAEAGSGKSAEFEGQCQRLQAAGEFALRASVSQVARAGLSGALVPADRAKLDAWKMHPDAVCWLFIDSIDEAKDQGFRLEDAARELADAISGREERARILISGRFTDWDNVADRAVVEKWLRLPAPPPEPAPAFEDEVRSTLRNKTRPAHAPTEELVAILTMTGLDPARVKLFAEQAAIPDLSGFLVAVDHGDLWHFAARPLDLAWMVAYWRQRLRLGTLREMIEESLTARLIDPDCARRRNDPLDAERCGHALDRIGAAFLLCGKDAVRVPVTGIDLFPAEKSLPIETLLPNWADRDRLRLLGRPVFDPATLGRARLHNDNEGTLRCYLAARWLDRLLKNNCPLQVVRDILFADLYGYRLVRPDMVDTSAWLAGFSEDIAAELIERAPLTLLKNGDPGSLPIATRIKTFAALLEQIEGVDQEKLYFLERSLRRFADPALHAYITEWWQKAGNGVKGRQLVLRLGFYGKYLPALRIANETVTDPAADELTRLLACRIVNDAGSSSDKARLARHIIDHAATLPRTLVLEALAELTPAYISIDQFFAIIDTIDINKEGGDGSIAPIDESLVDAITSLDRLIRHIVERSGALKGTGEPGDDTAFREAFAKIAASASVKLLGAYPDVVPDMITDLAMVLHETNRIGDADVSLANLNAEFQNSAGRRQSSFWRAVALMRTHPWHRDYDDVGLWSLQHLGWPAALHPVDLPWLLEDALGRPEQRDRINAFSVIFQIWRDNDRDADLLALIRKAIEPDPLLRKMLEDRLSPPPEDPASVRKMTEFRALEDRNKAQREVLEQSWVELIGGLKSDPSVFDRLNAMTDDTVDSRLYHLWQFTSARAVSRSRYSIDTLEIVKPIFGDDLTRKFGDALIAFAYERANRYHNRSLSPPPVATSFDSMALSGMALAAAASPNWATDLNDSVAKEAARLALVELNGFPEYMLPLAAAQPEIVRATLLKPALAQLDAGKAEGHGILDRLEYADPQLSALIADNLATYLDDHPDIAPGILEKLVSVVIRALPNKTDRLAAIARERAAASADPVMAAHYLLLLFAISEDAAVDALSAKVEVLGPAEQTALCSALLPRVVGGRFTRGSVVRAAFSMQQLEEMLLIAYRAIRVDDDVDYPDGVVYSFGGRDEAESARAAIFNRITETPGEATQATLHRLAAIPNFPIKPEWLRIHALRRAERDAELPAWFPEDVVVMERTHDHAPSTTADLQLLVRRRFEAVVHDLFDG